MVAKDLIWGDRQRHLVEQLQQQGIVDARVLKQIQTVPRHQFVIRPWLNHAYDNTALPLEYGQTISQPYIVAHMTQLLLAGQSLLKVLEIGTGSGYQTAILANLVKTVYTVERIKILLDKAKQQWQQLALNNIYAKCDDGYLGWQAHAPFDGMLVTAAASEIPEHLVAQLALNGRLVIPVGQAYHQELLLITKTPQGLQRQFIEPVSFVPLMKGLDTE